jgi:hypothetical protein
LAALDAVDLSIEGCAQLISDEALRAVGGLGGAARRSPHVEKSVDRYFDR